MKTLNLIHDKTGLEFELDLDIKEIMDLGPEEYIEKNERVKNYPKIQKQEKREEIISRIAKLWPQLEYQDKLEIIEIADLMRQGKWDRERKKTIEE